MARRYFIGWTLALSMIIACGMSILVIAHATFLK
jgi:hypothetical protein